MMLLLVAIAAKPVAAAISGPDTIWVPYDQCVTTTWTASTSFPSPTYQWTWDSYTVGTGSSYSRQVCHPGPTSAYSEWYGLAVWVSSGTQGAYDEQTIHYIFQAGDENGPCGFQIICEP
jgi:hypothetical protein